MFSIQHFLNKGDGDENNYSLFRMLEPTEQENKNNQESNESNENKGTQDNEVVVVTTTPEVTRQIMMDKYGDSEWLYAAWNARSILPSPMRLVMFRPSMCQLCGVVDENIGHTQFYTGHVYEHTGFNFCSHCKDKFFSALKARAEPIWEL